MYIAQTISLVAYSLIEAYIFILIIGAVLSWLPGIRENKVVALLNAVTAPVLDPVRRLLGGIPSLKKLPIDFSVIIVILLLEIIKGIIWG